MRYSLLGLLIFFCISVGAASWNNPHGGSAAANVRHAPFATAPKTLDPARSFSASEIVFLAQIYEPPLQYHYLKRPFVLEPLTAQSLPQVTYWDAEGQQLLDSTNPKKIAYTLYTINIKPGILYQPHPAFAKNKEGKSLYYPISASLLDTITKLSDFKYTGTRELTAADYVYQIKRLADPKVSSPIAGIMSEHIVGFKELTRDLQRYYASHNSHLNNNSFTDLRKFPLSGVKVIDKTHYQIKVNGYYPQFRFWLAMPFFAPMPWEALRFYDQAGMSDHNITLSWYPVGTGPYLISKIDPNKELHLQRNPNFRTERYPSEGEAGDDAKGYLQDAGRALPFIDLFVFNLEKESIPRWNKFLQGYYDKSGISSDSFDQAIQIDARGEPQLTEHLKQKNIRLQTSISPSVFYIGFNMLDPVVGGYTESKRKLRQAIAIALDYEEFIAIFMNGRGIIAHSPIPPGLAGHQQGQEGINPQVYYWQDGKAVRKPIDEAKQLLSEAGYPGGIDPKTGESLVLNYDVPMSGDPNDNARFNWLRKQLAKLGIELNVQASLYNRFLEKIRTGKSQLFFGGWNADYPDPENFLFLLYGPNSKVKFGGENSANYQNEQVDQLYEVIADLPDGPAREQKITELLKIIRRDSPWIWGFHPVDFVLSHNWNRPSKSHAVANNVLKYERLDPVKRQEARTEWNKPILWPLWALLGFIALLALPLVVSYWRREHKPTIKRFE